MGSSTILVIGSNRGIGLETVKQYLADGFKVLATCRQPQNAEALLALKEKHAKQLEIYPLEVTDQESRLRLAVALQRQPIDILFHCAGIYGADKGEQALGRLEESNWLKTLQTNSIAPIKTVEALLANLKASKRRVIALITSKMGSVADNSSGGAYIYRSSKAALNMAGKCLAVDLAPEQFTVLLLHPGWVKTDMGGANAPVTVEQSVQGLKSVIAKTTPAQNGHYLNFTGETIPW